MKRKDVRTTRVCKKLEVGCLKMVTSSLIVYKLNVTLSQIILNNRSSKFELQLAVELSHE